MINISILGSGYGSNAEAILQAHTGGALGDVRVAGIICDKEDARILSLGERYGVPALYLSPGKFKTKLSPEAEDSYVDQLKAWKTDLVVLAGFMRVIKEPLLKAYANRIINLHPSLLPKYPGLNSIRRAWEDGAAESGCTVHWVNEEIDAGQIIRQSSVLIRENESLEELEERVHNAEHELLPAVIKELSSTLSPNA